MHNIKKTLFILCCVFFGACTPNTRYTLHEDNDLLQHFSPNTDRNFTQGTQLSADTPDASGSTAYSVGQLIYTPGHKQLTTHQPEDRPYAGFLYASTDLKYRRCPTMQDTFGLTLGIVGPHSYAEQAQNGVHRIIGNNEARGWDNQIQDELGVIVKAQRDYAIPLTNNWNYGYDSDLVNTVGIHAGNVFDQIYAGSIFRAALIGNLPYYFTTGDIVYPRLPKEMDFSLNPWRVYVYTGPYLRAVARNIFLDGNTFHDSAHSPTKYPFVAEARAGLGIEYNSWRLEYTYILSMKEFKGQEDDASFGEINVSVLW